MRKNLWAQMLRADTLERLLIAVLLVLSALTVSVVLSGCVTNPDGSVMIDFDQIREGIELVRELEEALDESDDPEEQDQIEEWLEELGTYLESEEGQRELDELIEEIRTNGGNR